MYLRERQPTVVKQKTNTRFNKWLKESLFPFPQLKNLFQNKKIRIILHSNENLWQILLFSLPYLYEINLCTKYHTTKETWTVAGSVLKNHVFAQCTALPIVSNEIHFMASSYNLQQLVLPRSLTVADLRYKNEVRTRVDCLLRLLVLFSFIVSLAIGLHVSVRVNPLTFSTLSKSLTLLSRSDFL